MNKLLRTRFKERWTKLTDEELDLADGRADVLLKLLSEKYGYQRYRAEHDLLRFLEDSVSWAPGRVATTRAGR